MARIFLALVLCAGLSACGATPYASQNAASYRGPVAAPVMFATGPIQAACQKSGRKQASRAQCGCVQAVANQHLSAADQRRGAGYFADPHALQEVRQSSQRVASNGRFWAAWKDFGAAAERMCR